MCHRLSEINIGHCESAAGIARLTKVLLQMKHKRLAPSLHSRTLNPNIDFLATPFKVRQTLEEWKRPVINDKELPRTAGLSSFGAGGVNAHIVIEEYSADEDKETAFAAPHPSMIVLSAKNEQRLQNRRNVFLMHCGAALPGSDQAGSHIRFKSAVNRWKSVSE
ncbi:ketoacyl-synthetase C-terminal extension domain-containing protein [Bacillus velezensis]|nr:ketoacyl-synthetase C-terminal extension domain-containing protein [Bacillus velezensis]